MDRYVGYISKTGQRHVEKILDGKDDYNFLYSNPFIAFGYILGECIDEVEAYGKLKDKIRQIFQQ